MYSSTLTYNFKFDDNTLNMFYISVVISNYLGGFLVLVMLHFDCFVGVLAISIQASFK